MAFNHNTNTVMLVCLDVCIDSYSNLQDILQGNHCRTTTKSEQQKSILSYTDQL